MEAIRFEATIGQNGAVQVPDGQPGDRVEVIVLKLDPVLKPVRKGGWINGQITFHTDFDDPIPGMEDFR